MSALEEEIFNGEYWAYLERIDAVRMRYLTATRRLDFVRARRADQDWRRESGGLRALLMGQGWSGASADRHLREVKADADDYLRGFLCAALRRKQSAHRTCR